MLIEFGVELKFIDYQSLSAMPGFIISTAPKQVNIYGVF
jgi:hypothetical protein